MRLRAFLVIVGFVAFAGEGRAADKVLRVSTPMPAPTWALLERQALDSSAQACREFYRKYFDERGWLLCVERWGGDDGPDDAIENCNDWPILHALGASDDIRTMYSKAWEGHLRQFTLAKTTQVPFAKDGMYRCRSPRTACTTRSSRSSSTGSIMPQD